MPLPPPDSGPDEPSYNIGLISVEITYGTKGDVWTGALDTPEELESGLVHEKTKKLASHRVTLGDSGARILWPSLLSLILGT